MVTLRGRDQPSSNRVSMSALCSTTVSAPRPRTCFNESPEGGLLGHTWHLQGWGPPDANLDQAWHWSVAVAAGHLVPIDTMALQRSSRGIGHRKAKLPGSMALFRSSSDRLGSQTASRGWRLLERGVRTRQQGGRQHMMKATISTTQGAVR